MHKLTWKHALLNVRVCTTAREKHLRQLNTCKPGILLPPDWTQPELLYIRPNGGQTNYKVHDTCTYYKCNGKLTVCLEQYILQQGTAQHKITSSSLAHFLAKMIYTALATGYDVIVKVCSCVVHVYVSKQQRSSSTTSGCAKRKY